MYKKEVNMGIGEYIGFLTFGILSTGAVALRPQDLPLLIMGAFVFSIIFIKFFNWSYYEIGKSRFSFIIFGVIAGIFASIGIKISTDMGLILKINGVLWMFMAICLMKFNLDTILE